MQRFFPTCLLVVALIAAWQLLHLAIGAGALTSPWMTLTHLLSMMGTVELWANVGETAKAFAYAMSLALVGGIVLGVLLGVNRLAGAVAEPILLNLYAIPKVTLYPLVLLCFGLGLSSKVAFGVMHGLIPILLFTMNAIRQMRPVYLRTAGTLRLTPIQSLCHVLLPAILPEIVAGVRLGFALTLLGVLIGEMFASQRGLGYMAVNAMGLGDIPTIMAVALLLTLIAVTCNSLMLMLDKKLQHR
jgi:NitT/TauT family transport system permease protein